MATRNEVVKVLENLREIGVSDTDLLEHLVYNYFSSDDAYDSLVDYANDYDINVGQDDEEEENDE